MNAPVYFIGFGFGLAVMIVLFIVAMYKTKQVRNSLHNLHVKSATIMEHVFSINEHVEAVKAERDAAKAKPKTTTRRRTPRTTSSRTTRKEA